MKALQPIDLLARGAAQAGLHARAAAATAAGFGRRVFVRAVVEVSNHCRESCTYCGMRRENRALTRYRARWEELAELLIDHRPESVTDVMLQGGEDPVAAREVVLPLVKLLRRETRLGICVCLGTLDESHYAALRAAGADMYLMKFETASPGRYLQFRSPGSIEERLHHIARLAAAGWAVSSGFIAGLPGLDTADDWQAITLAATLPLVGCSVSPFIPGEATPLARAPGADVDQTLNVMAALRLTRPDWIIPAVSALNLGDPRQGYRRGLRCGANLVTMNLTPARLQGDYLLYRRDRHIMDEGRILAALEAEGLEPSATGLASHLGLRPMDAGPDLETLPEPAPAAAPA